MIKETVEVKPPRKMEDESLPSEKLNQKGDEEALFDGLMEEVGNDGRFQRRFNLLFNFVGVLFVTMPYTNFMLAMNVPDHWCHVPGREQTNMTLDEWKIKTIPRSIDAGTGTGEFSKCKMFTVNGTQGRIVDCQFGWDFDTTWYSRTVPSQEDWVCEKELYVFNTVAAGRVGEILGTIIFGQLGDYIGRRPVFFISLAILVLGRTVSVFVPHIFYLMLVAIALANVSTTSVFQSPLVIAMEVSAPEKRAQIAFVQCLGWVTGMCLLPMIAWVLRDWMWFMLATTLPCSIFLFLYKLLPESPRWLASRGRVDDSHEVLRYIAKINQRPLPPNTRAVLQKLAEKKEPVYGIPSIFSHWRMAKNALLIISCWSVCGVSYYTLLFNTNFMPGNPFMNYFWQCLVELPGYVCGRVLSNRFGRRWSQIAAYILGVMSAGASVLVYNSDQVYLTIIFMGLLKLSVSISFYLVYLQAIEIYPTPLRQTGISLGGLVSNVFMMLGPYVVYLGTAVDSRLPSAIMLALSIIGGTCAFFLPETLNQKLPETLEDGKNFGKDQGYWELTPSKKEK